jgi:prophage antirepressor-like protein
MGDIITLTTINEEPRVLDTDLAEALGMAAPRKVRDLIRESREELEGFGPLGAVASKSLGQHFTAYYLNEEQALLVCLLSRTERAKAVRAEVIRVFTAYRKGQLQPALPDFTNPAEAARARAPLVSPMRHWHR